MLRGDRRSKRQGVYNGTSLRVMSKAKSLHLSLLVPTWLMVLRTASEKARPKADDLLVACSVSHFQGPKAHPNLELTSWPQLRIEFLLSIFTCNLRCSRREKKLNEKSLSEGHLHAHMWTGGCLINV